MEVGWGGVQIKTQARREGSGGSRLLEGLGFASDVASKEDVQAARAPGCWLFAGASRSTKSSPILLQPRGSPHSIPSPVAKAQPGKARRRQDGAP